MQINAVEIARLTNTSKANISKLTRNNKLIRNENKKYDMDDPINKEYILSHGITKKDVEKSVIDKSIKNTAILEKTIKSLDKNTIIDNKPENIPVASVKKEVQKKDNFNKNIDEIDEETFEDITGLPAKMMNMTMKKLVMRYGGQMQLEKWANILNKLFSASERDQKIQERRLDLIEKDFAISKLFLYLETLSKLLFDFPESCIDNIIADIKSNKDNSRNLLVNNMRKDLGLLIEQTKKNIDRELEGLINKYKKMDNDE